LIAEGLKRIAQQQAAPLVKELSSKLNINKLEDWYTISQQTFIENLPVRSDLNGSLLSSSHLLQGLTNVDDRT